MRHEDIPEINNPKIRFPVLEGDKLMKEVLNGGYNVHPVPPPNSEIKERIMKRPLIASVVSLVSGCEKEDTKKEKEGYGRWLWLLESITTRYGRAH